MSCGGSAEMSMGQLFDEWESDPSDTEDTIEDSCASTSNVVPSFLRLMFHRYPLIERNRYVLGYSHHGKKCGRLLVRDGTDADLARFYIFVKTTHDGYHQYACPCKIKMVSTLVEGQVVVKGREEAHKPCCQLKSFRVLFFEMKKALMLNGTDEEIREIESATFAAGDEQTILVDQRNWSFEESDKVAKKSVMYIRNEMHRHLGRRYVLHKGRNVKSTYVCSGCPAEKKTSLTVKMSASGIPVVFKPADKQHAKTCSVKSIKNLALPYNSTPADYPDMDVFSVIPKENYTVGYSRLGEKDGRIIIKDSKDKTLCFEYGKLKYSTSTDRRGYQCTICCKSPYFAFYMPGDNPRLVSTTMSHEKCKPKSYEAVIDKQSDYSLIHALSNHTEDREAKAIAKAVFNDSESQMPMIPSDKFQFNEAKTELLVVNESDSKLTHKFVNADEVGGLNGTKTFKCVSCHCTALVSVNFHGRIIVRSYLHHKKSCKPRREDEWLVDEILSGPLVDIFATPDQPRENKRAEITIVKSRNSDNFTNDAYDSMSGGNSIPELSRHSTPEVSRKKIKRNVEYFSSAVREVGAATPKKPKLLHQLSGEGDGIAPGNPPMNLKSPQPNNVDCPVDLIELDSDSEDDVKPVVLPVPLKSDVFVRPSNLWLIQCCKLLSIPFSDDAYSVWAGLEGVNLKSSMFPLIHKVKQFSSGFLLVAFLCSGSEDEKHASIVKDLISEYFYDHQAHLGVIASVDCPNLDRSERKKILFSPEMFPVHFGILSKLLNCTVVIYNYTDMTRLAFEVDDKQVPTIVVGQNADGYFLFVRQT